MRALIAALLVTAAASVSRTPDDPLRLARVIELPGVQGRIDHLAFDAAGRKLFVAALGNNTVEVVDVAAGAHVRSLPGFREPQGIGSVPDLNLIAVANGQGEGLQFISADAGRPVRATVLGDDTDNVRYDRAARLVYAGYGSGAIAAVNPSDGTVVGRVALAGHPESFQLEAGGPRIFVNVPSARQIAVIDRTQMKVTATWPVTSAQSNYPLAVDDAGHRLFAGCRRPAKVLVFDTHAGTLLISADVVGDTDDLFYDSQRKRLYVSGGEGYVDVFDAAQPSSLTRIARVAGANGARTSLFVAGDDRLYLAVPRRGTQRAEIRVYEVRQ